MKRYILPLITCLLAGCSSLPSLPVEPVSVLAPLETAEAFAEADPIAVPNISQQFNEALVSRLPDEPTEKDKNIFSDYPTAREDNWLKGFDFSGVGWDSVRAGTLITPRHIVMAKHYQRPKGSKIVFTLPSGEPLTRTIIDTEAISMTDLAVGLLSQEATGCAVYPILSPGYDWQTALYGTYGFVTDQERKVLLYQISQLGLFCDLRGKDETTPDILRETLITGDSGNPSFLPYGNNKLVLLSTHWFGGAGGSGPNVAEHRTREALVDAINAVNKRSGS